MRRSGHTLGGEQSGHVILAEYGTTGDGVLTGLMLAARMAETGRTIADLGTVMTRMPQVLVNVKGVGVTQVRHLKDAQEWAADLVEAVTGDRGAKGRDRAQDQRRPR